MSRRAWLLVATAIVASAAATSCAKLPATTPSPTPAVSANSTSPSATPPGTLSPQPSSVTLSQAPTTATLVFSGDLLWHNTLWMSAADDHKVTGKGKDFDFDPMFAAMKPTIEGADLAVCHEEVPFAAEGGPYTGYPVFHAPPQIAPWIASMGWDACTLTSNHSLDAGQAGLVRANRLLASNGVQPVGTYATEDASRKPVIVDAHGIKVALIGSTYDLNGLAPDKGKEWSVQRIVLPQLLARAKQARAAGADLVIVQVHAGDEYVAEPNAQQKQVAQALTASPDVDIVVGQHAHVVQPITRVNGKWVVYGMGNMVAQHKTDVPRAYEGITVRFTATRSPSGSVEITGVEYIATLTTHYGPDQPVRLLPVVASLDAGTGPTLRLQQARTSVQKAVTLLGTTPGLTER